MPRNFPGHFILKAFFIGEKDTVQEAIKISAKKILQILTLQKRVCRG